MSDNKHLCCVHTAHCYAETLCPECFPAEPEAGDDMVAVELVPVAIAEGNECCEHGDTERNPDCTSRPSLGLMDETGGLSDCNRARGKLYRRQDIGLHRGHPDPENIVVQVRRADLPWFDKVWDHWDIDREREDKRLTNVVQITAEMAYDRAIREVAGVDPAAIHNPYRKEAE